MVSQLKGLGWAKLRLATFAVHRLSFFRWKAAQQFGVQCKWQRDLPSEYFLYLYRLLLTSELPMFPQLSSFSTVPTNYDTSDEKSNRILRELLEDSLVQSSFRRTRWSATPSEPRGSRAIRRNMPAMHSDHLGGRMQSW